MTCNCFVNRISKLHFDTIIYIALFTCNILDFPVAFKWFKNIRIRNWTYKPFLSRFSNLYREQRILISNPWNIAKTNKLKPNACFSIKASTNKLIRRFISCWVVNIACCHITYKCWVWIHILNNSKEAMCIEK